MEIDRSLAYPLSHIDPHIDVEVHEERRLDLLKPVLRAFAKSVDNASLVDPDSDASFGSLLAPQAKAELGKPIVESIFGMGDKKCKACLISPTHDILTPQEADQLPDDEREECIAIRGEPNVARKRVSEEGVRPQVILTVPSTVYGGLRDAKMNVEPISKSEVRVSIVSASGARKYMNSGQLPEVLVARLFATDTNTPKIKSGPRRVNVLTNVTQSAISDFLKRKRLHVLCTAAEPAPIVRPLVLENAYLRPFKRTSTSWASLRVVLHASSSSCVCPAHGLRIDGKSRVEINIETCGRDLEKTLGGKMRCPCHRDALDAEGNSKNNMEGMCTENTTINLRCLHTHGEGTRATVGARLDNILLDHSERMELTTIITNALDFEARTRDLFNAKGFATNQPEIDRHANEVGNKLRDALDQIELERQCKLLEEEPGEPPVRDMPQRDETAVKLMRGGGVRLRIQKKGIRKGRHLLERKSYTNEMPLCSCEAKVASTHGHLFRKAM